MEKADILKLKAGLEKQYSGPWELVETHISWVLLGPDQVFKLKKPVQFSFLDFSTQEQRAHFCRQELALNRRLEPEVYLEVVEIWCHAGRCQVGPFDEPGQGAIVDHAVRMRRLNAARQMHLLLEQNAVSPSQVAALARKVADFHREAEVIRVPAQGSGESYLRDFADILSVEEVVQQQVGACGVQSLQRAVEQSRAFLRSREELLRQRLEAGWIRDVHGDLHARNIFLDPDPIVFDCIEFNAHFRQIDVLNEVAFLCMDLEADGHPELSQVFLDEYLASIPAAALPGSLELLHWFQAYRANVRAKVLGLQFRQVEDPARQAAMAADMRHYLELMEAYLNRLDPAQAPA